MNVDILGTNVEIDETHVAEPPAAIREQVCEYACGDRRDFDLTVAIPNDLTGAVMDAMAAIPYGETRTYGEIADDLATAPIAVGRACGANPVPIVVPCHRVVGSDGSLTGYSAADGIVTKRKLLDLEAREAGTEPVQARLPTESSEQPPGTSG